jgi:hypothetical protein
MITYICLQKFELVQLTNQKLHRTESKRNMLIGYNLEINEVAIQNLGQTIQVLLPCSNFLVRYSLKAVSFIFLFYVFNYILYGESINLDNAELTQHLKVFTLFFVRYEFFAYACALPSVHYASQCGA